MFKLNQADAAFKGNKLGLTGLGEVTMNGFPVATMRDDLSRADVADFENLLEAVTELDQHMVDKMTDAAYDEGWEEGRTRGYDDALDYAATDVESLSEDLGVALPHDLEFSEEQMDAIYALVRSIADDIRNMEYK